MSELPLNPLFSGDHTFAMTDTIMRESIAEFVLGELEEIKEWELGLQALANIRLNHPPTNGLFLKLWFMALVHYDDLIAHTALDFLHNSLDANLIDGEYKDVLKRFDNE